MYISFREGQEKEKQRHFGESAHVLWGQPGKLEPQIRVNIALLSCCLEAEVLRETCFCC